jgi:hypothetical protein
MTVRSIELLVNATKVLATKALSRTGALLIMTTKPPKVMSNN